MIKQYFRQAVSLLREDRLISTISILGTALAIAMIMVVVITQRVKTTPLAPELNRDRTLLFRYLGLQNKQNPNGQTNGPVSYKMAKECFKELKTPQAVTVFAAYPETMLASKPVGNMIACDVNQTDDAFWQVFSFSFLDGKPYDNADFEAGLSKVVIAESIAGKIFGTEQAVGRTIMLNHTEYTVCGVVKDVSLLTEKAYGQAWIPFTATNLTQMAWGAGRTMGMLQVAILAHSKKEFPAIRKEVESLKQSYETGLQKYELLYREQPDTYFIAAQRGLSATNVPDMTKVIIEWVTIILILLLVPGINLSGMTLSRMRKRMSEVGIRKAFGASKAEIMLHVLSENLFYSLLGGLLGLLFSYMSLYIMSGFFFRNMITAVMGGKVILGADILFSPQLFIVTFFFCLVLNLISAFIPAWQISNKNIVDSLNER